MPVVVSVYLGIYLLLTIANCVYCLSSKISMKLSMLLYELLSGVVVVFMAFAYWLPALRAWTGLGCALALLAVVAVDVRMTIWSSTEELGVPESDFEPVELDIVKGIALAFAGPAYVMGLLLAVDKITPFFKGA